MLDTLRSAAGTWVSKLLLLLLVLSFAVWGISGQIATGVGDSVVTAGSTTVSPIEYRLAYDRQMSVMSQRFGTRLTREQAAMLGVDDQVLAQLVAGAVLDEQARSMGLGVSRDRVAVLTAQDPAFRGANGSFDRSQFEFVLRQIGMRPEDYLKNREQVAVRQQIVDAVSEGMTVPDTFLKAVALYQGEDRTVEYLVLPPALVEPIEEPEDAALATWFDARKGNYAAPEYRKISYVKLEPADIADPAAITDEQVAEDYNGNLKAFTTPERRSIEQLVFSGEDAARLAADRIGGGATFEEVVAAEGKTMDDVRLGKLEKARVPDPAVADAAFGLQANQVSGVIAGAFGPVMVRVTEITPEVVKPLAEVAQQIRTELAIREASAVLADVHDRYEDARAAGESMAEAAAAQGLKVVTVEAVDRSGQDPQGNILRDLPESQELLRRSFESEVGVENAPITIGSSGYLFFELDAVTPRRERPLDEVRERVVNDWKAEERTARLAAKAAEIEKRAKDGASLDEIAAELSLEKQTKRGVRRGAEDPDLGAGGVAAVFSVAESGVGSAPAPAGGSQIVFKVTETFEPAGASAESVPAQNREAYAAGMSDDLLDQLVRRLQDRYGVTVNRAAMQQALAF